MKILLAAVNAKYIHSNLAVYCLRAYAKEQHPASNITISEYTIPMAIVAAIIIASDGYL